MVAFARARTKSLISRLWPLTVEPINKKTDVLNKSKELIEVQREQNKSFLETCKNGGMWFS